MELWIGALNLGFLYAFLAIGALITYKIQNFADITVDGSFTCGAATSAVLIIAGFDPFISLLAAFVVGGIAGMLTGIIHTKLKINGLLAGILVMIALYSINLHIMGKSNIPLLEADNFMQFFDKLNPGLDTEIWLSICLAVVMAAFWVIITAFFKTDFGITIRATGNNPTMIAASGVNVRFITIFGVALSNALAGLSGGLVAQYQGFADIGMGIGTLMIGLASVIIGDSIFKSRSILFLILGAVIGSLIYRYMIAIALFVGMNPIDLKLLTSFFVLITLIVTKFATDKKNNNKSKFFNIKLNKRFIASAKIFAASAAICALAFFAYKHFLAQEQKKYKIAVVQVVENGILNITRDAFINEMNKLGFKDGDNCIISLENAHGDVTTLNSIIDKIVMDKYDIIVAISTPATQAALSKAKNIPIVFATVANPFIIKAGTDDDNHLSNVTGVYGWVPMAKTLDYATKIFNKNIKIGVLWDPAFENSVFNVSVLKKAVEERNDVEFIGATISNSSELYNAAQSLTEKNIDCFILPADNIVYSAFESVVKAAKKKNIPIIISDPDRLNDGAFMAYGFDYSASGIQTAHIVKRIIDGEKPADIPFERYNKLDFAINFKVAKELNINLPNSLISKITKYTPDNLYKTNSNKKIGIVQFSEEPNCEFCKKGIAMALAANGFEEGKNLDIVYKNCNADFSMMNAIMQDLTRRQVDIIIPLSTPCVQAAIQAVKDNPKTKVVYTYIFNPYAIGAAKSKTEHLQNATGVACPPKIENMIDLIKTMFPQKKKIGVVWNSSEANSESTIKDIKQYIKSTGHILIEATVTSPAEVLEASRSLISKGAEIFLNAGDNTLNVSYDSFSKVADDNKIPLFSVDAELIYNNSLACLGPDYFKTGWDGGVILADVLKGANVASIPLVHTEETLFFLNLDVAKKLGITIAPELINKADKVIETKLPKNKKSSSVNQKNVAVFQFNDFFTANIVTEAVLDELKALGTISKHNLNIKRFNAQNEFNMAQSIAQDIAASNFDYIITLSTPALQVVANTNKKVPQIFGFVTDPYIMGIAKTPENHIPNITGIATSQPVDYTFQLINELFPKRKKMGIVWNPAEACSQVCVAKARIAAKKFNIELIEATVTNTSEIMDAVNNLIAKKIDIFLTSGDNTVNLAIKSIAALLRKKQIPYISNNADDIEAGTVLSIGADYVQVGKEIARLANIVIDGKNTKDIPITSLEPDVVYLNMKLMKEYGYNPSDNFIKKCKKVIY